MEALRPPRGGTGRQPSVETSMRHIPSLLLLLTLLAGATFFADSADLGSTMDPDGLLGDLGSDMDPDG
jgi:hypothetical protein